MSTGRFAMHSDTVTIFNFYDSSTTAIWYPHVLSGVHLETDRGQIMKLYGPDSTDNAQLHIPFVDKDGKRVVVDASGKELPWLPPKEWRKQVNDLLDDSITFNPTTDFFMAGVWDGEGPIDDADYTDRRYEGFYAFMNAEKDFVYLISSVGGPYKVIPHFEILGK